jgi:signal transduction histidine kinase
MGGGIETESVEGQGTRVTIELPVQERVTKT